MEKSEMDKEALAEKLESSKWKQAEKVQTCMGETN